MGEAAASAAIEAATDAAVSAVSLPALPLRSPSTPFNGALSDARLDAAADTLDDLLRAGFDTAGFFLAAGLAAAATAVETEEDDDDALLTSSTGGGDERTARGRDSLGVEESDAAAAAPSVDSRLRVAPELMLSIHVSNCCIDAADSSLARMEGPAVCAGS